MRTERPTFVTKPQHLARVFAEQDSIEVRPATITTGQADVPAIPGIAIVVSGAARIILPAHQGWKLSDQLADTLEAIEHDSDPADALQRHDGLHDAAGEPAEPLPATQPED